MRRRALVSVSALVVVAAVGAGGAYAAWGYDPVSASRAAADRRCEPAYVTSPITPPLTSLPWLRRRLVMRLGQPTAMAFHPGGVAVVAERTGEVYLVEPGGPDRPPVLDLSADTGDEGDAGLLSVTYDPDGDWLFVYRTDADLDDVVTAYPSPGGMPDPDGEVTILEIDHPTSKMHHGGGFAFGPDGALYIGTGDGGGLGDPNGNAQRLDTVLGKLLRIQPTPGDPEPYSIPADNPFVDRAGARPEIFSYGLRNPFRLAFDRATGDLWLADVGHSCWEEIDFRPAGRQGGENFGWDRREGTHAFEGPGPGGDVLPLHDYSHRHGWCVVVGGFVYRGRAIPALDGAYLFTDFCKGEVLTLRQEGGVRTALERTTLGEARPVALLEDLDGEPWMLSLDGGVYRVVP